MKSNELKASDLRIGNLVEAHLPDGPYFICKVNYDLLKMLDNKNTNEYYKPIPLTEEILVRLGFTGKENLWFECQYFSEQDADDINIICINLDSGRCCLTTEYHDNYVYAAKEIRYLHHLQNLYFALTGEELTLKEI